MEGHPNFLLNIFLYCWNVLLPFFNRHNSFCALSILGQQLSYSRSIVSKTSRLKLKREVSRTEKNVQDYDYVFGSSTMFQRRKEWICESRCRQVSVLLHVFAEFFCPYCAFHKYANSKVQKAPSQLRFSLPSIIITITSNEP